MKNGKSKTRRGSSKGLFVVPAVRLLGGVGGCWSSGMVRVNLSELVVMLRQAGNKQECGSVY